ncbi:glucose dehydrogenase [FAD, quinone]-like isoform X2 [Coccinella septempunctata]|uniref:glucose dehydrogenase [FAD, quinone]-like isoform X2 n=1 Tax=Coccinella septempunctata TaxID=41139 RepID=UPI001D09426A|nr:glucose dehydrogenase [FAD, quinone]-like isoform X2 [Coccinella septempunctata]
MRHIVFVILLVFFGSVENEKNSELELKIDYYEALIKKAVKDAANYKPRIDNSDFLSDVDRTKVHDYGTFDFIIVGAGSSGSVVASRLSEHPDWKILLIEAGDHETDLSEIPGMHVLLPNSDKNWGYTTTKQKYGCKGMVGEKCPYARGKSVGGSGAINGIMYIRGHKEDYDKWERWGNPGWSYQNISYYFKKSENSQIPDGDQGYHGFAGPINNCYTTPESPLVQAFIDANKELGASYIDVNGGQPEGVGKCQSSALFGRRVSSASAYLKTALNRINLNLEVNALVTKILIDEESKKAQGVLFVKDGKTYRAMSSKEVILSGGSINTPQLLMLSGVGPEKELEKHSIKMIKNAPVGQTMRDHIAFSLVFFRTNHSQSITPLREQIKDYLNGYGILTTSFSTKALSFKNFGDSRVEFILIPPSGKAQKNGAPRNFNKEVLESLKSYDATTDFLISAILLNPKSNGTITLKSSDPLEFPELDIGIFSSEEDLDALYEGVKYAQTLGNTKSFEKFNAKQFIKFKPCDQHGYNTKDFWYCAMKHLSFNGYHMSSTARMGPEDDPMAVVDSELQVYGVKGLRIIDCSVMPDTISGHTNAIAFAIGEKGADIIKNHYGVFRAE